MANNPNSLFGGPIRILSTEGTGHISVICKGIDDVSTCKMRVWFAADPATTCESDLIAGPLPNTYIAKDFSNCSLDWPDGSGGLMFLYAETEIQIDGGNGNMVSRPLNVLILDPTAQSGQDMIQSLGG